MVASVARPGSPSSPICAGSRSTPNRCTIHFRRSHALSIRNSVRFVALGLLVVMPVRDVQADQGAAFDLVIANGHVIDGTGSPWYAADIRIPDGPVAALGGLARA